MVEEPAATSQQMLLQIAAEAALDDRASKHMVIGVFRRGNKVQVKGFQTRKEVDSYASNAGIIERDYASVDRYEERVVWMT